MATASSPTFPFAALSLCCLLVLCNYVPYATSVSFDLDFTTQNSIYTNLAFDGDASFQSGMIELTRNDRSTANINNSLGMVWYRQPVPLWDNSTGELVSFTTNFSFQIKIDTGSNKYAPGDGMTFFLTHYQPVKRDLNWLNITGGGSLGLFNGTTTLTGDYRTVAVEFDTFHNHEWNESTAQHVGIDVNSIESAASTDTISPDELIAYDETMRINYATVNYDNGTKLLAVDLRISNTLYHVNYTIDLRSVLPESVSVGFSATNGFSAELHQVLSWSFSSTTLLSKMSPSPAPATASQTLVTKPQPSKKLILMVIVPIILACAIAGILLWVWRKPRRNLTKGSAASDSESDEQHDGPTILELGSAGPKRYQYRDLADATSDFADEGKLGRGGSGSVYKGLLRSDDQPDGVPVAIKLFSSDSSSQGRKQFEAEVRIISQIRHRNLVRLLGWCDSRKGLLLVYELVPEGSLDKQIYNTERLLTWSERYKIILGLGSALCYLHQEWEQCVVHGDVKPSNIMLDSEYNTKLGDFGLARLVDHGKGSQTTETVAGTAGYMDPEFVITYRASTQSDIYSFGVVLLEIVSGRAPVERHQDAPPFMLLKWVSGLYDQKTTIDAADKRLRGNEYDERQMERALVVGLWCAHPDPSQRPSIAQAMHVLRSDDLRLLPALPPRMYVPLPVNFAMGESSLSASSGVHSSATTATGSGTTRSSGSFAS